MTPPKTVSVRLGRETAEILDGDCAAPGFYNAKIVFRQALRTALSVDGEQGGAQRIRELEEESNFLLRWLGGFNAELDGLSADAMTVAAFYGTEPTRAPSDLGDLGRCEKAYEAAPIHLQKRMLPILEKHRAALHSKDVG